MHAQHCNVPPVPPSVLMVKALLAHNDAYRLGPTLRISLHARSLRRSERKARTGLLGTTDEALGASAHTKAHKTQDSVPLVQEVAIGIDDIRLAKLVLNQGHDMRQIRLARVLPVLYRHPRWWQ